MAVTTNYKRQEETAKNTQQVQSAQPYQGMNGVSQNTANNLGNYQQGYKPNEQVQQAQQNLQNVQAQKPQTYNSKYSAQLDNIMQQIQNPQQFKYEFNGDNLFKSYADLYTQKGKQASLDTMGQAAALTGGYGNSYAQAAGNQAYQQYLLGLYDKGMELQDAAYNRYLNNLNNQKDIYNMLQGADATDYGRYRDTVGDWQTEEEQAYNRLQNAQNFDYQDYQNSLDYYTGLAKIENAAYNTEAERQEAIRQYNQNYAYNIAANLLNNGQMPTDEQLAAAGISKEDAKKWKKAAKNGTGSGSGGGGGGSNKGNNNNNNNNNTSNSNADVLAMIYAQAAAAGQQRMDKVKPTSGTADTGKNKPQNQTK